METKKELLNELKKLNVELFNYDMEAYYSKLYNLCIDYGNESGDWQFEDYFNDIVDYETCEELAKNTLEKDGLIRLYYFLGDANFNNNLFKIDGYGNLKDIYIDDIDSIRDSIIYELENQIIGGEK